jgi:hypothetical protein
MHGGPGVAPRSQRAVVLWSSAAEVPDPATGLACCSGNNLFGSTVRQYRLVVAQRAVRLAVVRAHLVISRLAVRWWPREWWILALASSRCRRSSHRLSAQQPGSPPTVGSELVIAAGGVRSLAVRPSSIHGQASISSVMR